MRSRSSIWCIVISWLVFLPAIVQAQVIPTPEWISLWSDSITFNNQPLPVGSVIRAYDEQQVLCGEFTVIVAGQYGLMPVYRDDPLTTFIDEGAEPGDTLSFTIDGNQAQISGSNVPIWTFNGDIQKVILSVERVIPTSEWISLWSDDTDVFGNPVEIGAVIKARDPQGVVCGKFIVATPGSYGLMPVYRDDPLTADFDEGAEPGDRLSFTIDGKIASDEGPNEAVWTFNGDVKNVNLKVSIVPTMLQSSSLHYKDNGVLITWTLHEMVDREALSLWRRSGDEYAFKGCHHVEIMQEKCSYTAIDSDIDPGGQYEYRVLIYNAEGETTIDLGSIEIPVVSSISLSSIPNPFQHTITFVFEVPEISPVSLGIYDVQGKLIRRLVDHRSHQTGTYSEQWDGKNELGIPVTKGVYFTRYTVGNRHVVRKIILVR